MPVETINSNAFPMSIQGVSAQRPAKPIAISPGTAIPRGNPVQEVIAPVQVMGLVPLFSCTSTECRAGIYTADTIADDTQWTLPVFATPNFSGSYYNDSSPFWFDYPGTHNPITLGEFHLQRLNQSTGVWSSVATLNNTTYGIP